MNVTKSIELLKVKLKKRKHALKQTNTSQFCGFLLPKKNFFNFLPFFGRKETTIFMLSFLKVVEVDSLSEKLTSLRNLTEGEIFVV